MLDNIGVDHKATQYNELLGYTIHEAEYPRCSYGWKTSWATSALILMRSLKA